ncbi:UDP-N-acetylglucosamine 2-epimerase (hydrolyzing) [bacterium K02(2017)]|nr:UDP-N-acetylglucosamine 2-epimerase (hydrolyzing) [bacterium K02(2017)]
MKKKIICVTGCRSEYDICYSVLKRFQNDDSFDLSIVVTGAHLSENYGYTVKEIEADGFFISDRIQTLIDSDKEVGKIKGSGLLMLGLSDALNRLNPAYVMVVGDREEAIISAVVCTYMGIPLIHLCGGDSTLPEFGDVDEPIRHATSKMANIHFTMNETHQERLIKMGEEPWRILNTGNPALDRFEEIKSMSKSEILKYFKFDEGDKDKPLVFILQHVISGEFEDGAKQIKETLEAILSLKVNCIMNYPNTDMGSRDIIKVMESYKGKSQVRIEKNIPRKEFVNLLRNIDLLVGNSSLALLEGGFLKLPAINVGERNKDRMNGGNVIFVNAKSKDIKETAQKILTDKDYQQKLKNCKMLYGKGDSSKLIYEYVKKINKTKTELIAKKMTY